MSVPLIRFENVTIQRDDRIALDRIDLSIAQGEHVAILGPNGSGKSKLIKVISRELYPVLKEEPWALQILGRDRWHLFELRNHLGIGFQRLDADVPTAQSLRLCTTVTSHRMKTTGSLADPNLSLPASPRTFSLWSRVGRIMEQLGLALHANDHAASLRIGSRRMARC